MTINGVCTKYVSRRFFRSFNFYCTEDKKGPYYQYVGYTKWLIEDIKRKRKTRKQ